MLTISTSPSGRGLENTLERRYAPLGVVYDEELLDPWAVRCAVLPRLTWSIYLPFGAGSD
jgi:hypothetical protein